MANRYLINYTAGYVICESRKVPLVEGQVFLVDTVIMSTITVHFVGAPKLRPIIEYTSAAYGFRVKKVKKYRLYPNLLEARLENPRAMLAYSYGFKADPRPSYKEGDSVIVFQHLRGIIVNWPESYAPLWEYTGRELYGFRIKKLKHLKRLK